MTNSFIVLLQFLPFLIIYLLFFLYYYCCCIKFTKSSSCSVISVERYRIGNYSCPIFVVHGVLVPRHDIFTCLIMVYEEPLLDNSASSIPKFNIFNFMGKGSKTVCHTQMGCSIQHMTEGRHVRLLIHNHLILMY